MASIPSIAYLIIGVLVTAYSWFVKRFTGDERIIMDVFMYIGILLIVIGVVKLVMKALKKPKKHKADHHKEHHEEQPVHHYKTHPTQETHHTRHKIIYCSCGTKNYSTSNFCHKCGKPLK